MAVINPFVVGGYVSPRYFCDRVAETENLIRNLINGSNVALVSTRRMGKTGLIRHCFYQPLIKEGYYTFFIDIYATSSLKEFVFALGIRPRALGCAEQAFSRSLHDDQSRERLGAILYVYRLFLDGVAGGSVHETLRI